MKYEFAIRKQELGSGRVIFTPVCRKKPISKFLLINPPWERITQVYDKYLLMDVGFEPDLSYEECKEHIHGFQEQLKKSKENDVVCVEFDALEEKDLTFNIKQKRNEQKQRFKSPFQSTATS